MRIGIDALYIRPGKVGGTESYLRNLLKGLEFIDDRNEYYIFLTESNYQTFSFTKENFRKINCPITGDKKLSRVFYVNIALPKLINNLKLDIMFFPTYIRPIYKFKKTITVSNVHDIQYKHFPEYFSFLQKVSFNIFYPVSLSLSQHVICISEFVKDDIEFNFKKINKDKFSKIYNPIDFDKFDCISTDFTPVSNAFKITSSEYILSVASLLPHKNVETLIRAFGLYKYGNANNIKLVLVGIKSKTTSKLGNLIDELDLVNDVIITGFINDEMLSSLYKNARLFVSTSLFEGFGMPPIEAMYKKLPTISTRCASLQEVTKNLAFYYDNPTDSQELSNLIKRVLPLPLDNPRLDYISKVIKDSYELNTICQQYIELFEYLYKNSQTH